MYRNGLLVALACHGPHRDPHVSFHQDLVQLSLQRRTVREQVRHRRHHRQGLHLQHVSMCRIEHILLRTDVLLTLAPWPSVSNGHLDEDIRMLGKFKVGIQVELK